MEQLILMLGKLFHMHDNNTVRWLWHQCRCEGHMSILHRKKDCLSLFCCGFKCTCQKKEKSQQINFFRRAKTAVYWSSRRRPEEGTRTMSLVLVAVELVRSRIWLDFGHHKISGDFQQWRRYGVTRMFYVGLKVMDCSLGVAGVVCGCAYVYDSLLLFWCLYCWFVFLCLKC